MRRPGSPRCAATIPAEGHPDPPRRAQDRNVAAVSPPRTAAGREVSYTYPTTVEVSRDGGDGTHRLPAYCRCAGTGSAAPDAAGRWTAPAGGGIGVVPAEVDHICDQGTLPARWLLGAREIGLRMLRAMRGARCRVRLPGAGRRRSREGGRRTTRNHRCARPRQMRSLRVVRFSKW